MGLFRREAGGGQGVPGARASGRRHDPRHPRPIGDRAVILCSVVGEAISTVKHASLDRRKLLLLQPVTPEGRPDGERFLALDTVGAGRGEVVLVNQEGR
ncbi:MAG: hypothetical protein EHM19_13385, partial [Candidatus Latescibacterota bacterium]